MHLTAVVATTLLRGPLRLAPTRPVPTPLLLANLVQKPFQLKYVMVMQKNQSWKKAKAVVMARQIRFRGTMDPFPVIKGACQRC